MTKLQFLGLTIGGAAVTGLSMLLGDALRDSMDVVGASSFLPITIGVVSMLFGVIFWFRAYIVVNRKQPGSVAFAVNLIVAFVLFTFGGSLVAPLIFGPFIIKIGG